MDRHGWTHRRTPRSHGDQVPAPKEYFLGCVALARGDAARSRLLFEKVRPQFETEVAATPLDSFRHAQLGLLYAYLGRKGDAIREGRRAVELTPETKDALIGPMFSGVLAMIYAQVAEADRAIASIAHLVTTPGSVGNSCYEASFTLHDLRHRWQWDPLRKDPRFQKILAGPEPKTLWQLDHAACWETHRRSSHKRPSATANNSPVDSKSETQLTIVGVRMYERRRKPSI
jgi:hypothetical protein